MIVDNDYVCTQLNDNVLIIKDVEDDEIIYTKMTELGIEHKYLDSVTARELGVKKIKKSRR